MTNLSDLLVNYQSNETLDSVTSRGATTTNDLTIGNLLFSTGASLTSSGVNSSLQGSSGNTGSMALYGGPDYNGGSGIAVYGASHSSQADKIRFFTSGFVERMVMSSDGDMHISTLNTFLTLGPTLNSSGTGTGIGIRGSTPRMYFEPTADGQSSRIIFANTGGTQWGSIYAFNDTERMQFSANTFNFNAGNVGIGTTSPIGNLHVQQNTLSTNGIISLVGSNSAAPSCISQIQSGEDPAGNGSAFMSFHTRGPSGSFSAPTERMRIDSSGNVGIGETNPTTGKLVVLNTDNDDYAIRIGNIAGASGSLVGITKIGLDTGTSSPTHPSAAIEVEQAAISGYQADLVFSTRKSNSDVAPTESLRIDSEGKVSNGTGTTKNYTYFPLPYFSLGASGITDEYLIISRYNDTGSAVVATGVDGEILFSRGNTGAGNAQEKVEISVQDAWTGTPRVMRFNTSDVRRFIRLDIITVDSQKYVAARAAASGGGSTNHIFFRGIVTGESTDSKLLTRVRESDSNVTVNTTGWMYPASFEYRDDTTGGFLGIRVGGADVGRFDSDGLKFGTDSAAANALDDYEEGSFTADIRDGTSSVSIGTGYYTKVGNICTCTINGYNQNISSLNTSHLRLGGLPFNASTNGVAIGRVSCSNFETAFVQFISAQNYGFMYGNLNSGPNVKSLVKTDFASQTGASIWITVTYRTV